MGIEDIQISEELETNAPSIKYRGDEGPKSPQEEQEIAMKMAMAMEAEQAKVSEMAMAEEDMMVKEDYSSRAYRDKLIQQLMDTGGLDYGSASNEADRIIEIKLRPKAAFGGIMGLDGRRQYGLGSSLKKRFRKLIPNEVAKVAEVAAPFVAPFNPIAAGLMSGIGGFDRTGRIGSSIKSGLMNYGMGQLSRGIGGGMDNLQGASLRTMPGQTGFGSYFSSPIQSTGGLGKLLQGTADKTFATTGGSMDAYAGMGDPVSTGMDLVKKPGFVESIGNKISSLIPESTLGKIALGGGAVALGTALLGGGPEETVDAIMDRGEGLDIAGIRAEVTEAFKDQTGEKLLALRSKYPYLGTAASKNTAIMADGGRIGLKEGGGLFKKLFANNSTTGSGVMSSLNTSELMDVLQMLQGIAFAKGGRAGFKDGGLTEYESYRLKNMGYDTKGGTVLEPFGGLSVLKDILRVNKAMGGMTSRTPMEEGGIMDLGGMEKDYRAEGGFVPIGKKEKADDVPARLSVNEFVFTADAVRNAGGGDIDKGAEVMENMMKNLEAGGQVSEESQGMQGARDMFQTSQSLEGVM